MIKFRAQSDDRLFALRRLLGGLEEKILNDTTLCDKAFRLSEIEFYEPYTDKKIIKFSIDEIPTTVEQLTIPSRTEMSILPRKYTFKERIRILFKGK